MLALKLILIGTLSVLVYEDLHTRTVNLWHLLLVGACLGIPALSALRTETALLQIGYNLFFIVAQLAIVMLWSLHKHGLSGLNIFKFIGAGDLVFFVILAIGLAPSRFMLFYISGLTLCIPAFLVMTRLYPKAPKTIPTAGFLAAYLGCWQLIEIAGGMGPFYMDPLS